MRALARRREQPGAGDASAPAFAGLQRRRRQRRGLPERRADGADAARSWRCCAPCSPGPARRWRRSGCSSWCSRARPRAGRGDRGGGLPPAQAARRHRRAAGDAARAGLPAEGLGVRLAAAVAAQPAAAGHPAAGAVGLAGQHRQPVPPGAARGRHRLRPHAAGQRQVDRRAARGQRRRRCGARAVPPCPTPRSKPSRPTTAAACSTRSAASQGEMVSGFEDLPAWRGKLPDKGPYAALVDFYDDVYRDAAGARGGAAAAGGQRRGPRHGHDPGGRDAGAAPDAGAPDPARHAVAAGGAAGRADRAGGGVGGAARHAAGARAERAAARPRARTTSRRSPPPTRRASCCRWSTPPTR